MCHPAGGLLTERLAADHEPHRGEDTGSASPFTADTSGLEHDLCLGGTLWYDHDGFESREEDREDPEDDRIELKSRKNPWLPSRGQWTIPRLTARVRVERRVSGLEKLEAGIDYGLGAE